MKGQLIKYITIVLITFTFLLAYYSFTSGSKCNYVAQFKFTDNVNITTTCKRGKVSEVTYKLDNSGNVIFSGVKAGRQLRIGSYILLYQYYAKIIAPGDDSLNLEFINSNQYNFFFYRGFISDDKIYLFHETINDTIELFKGEFSGEL